MTRKTLSVLLSVVMVFSMFNVCVFANNGTTYYIDPVNGDDSNSGTGTGNAWKTLRHASLTVYSSGDKILLKKGEIYLDDSFDARGNGTKDNPVTLGTYGDEELARPVLTSENEISFINLNNVSGWTVEGLEMTAPEGRGIYIRAGEDHVCEYITVKNCVFHDFHYVSGKPESNCAYPILVAASGKINRLRHITVSGCDIYHCGYGIVTDGNSREWSADDYISPEESYNSDYVFENLSLSDILYDGIVIMSVMGMRINNCSFIRCAMDTTKATASVWTHHADNVIIENCEIAGSENYNDGMTVDFDGWTTNSTYQYIYSHDNQRFINNCCYDGKTRNENCMVRYCLSVNDCKLKNSMAQIMDSKSVDYGEGEMSDYMDKFKFYNNTIINMGEMEINNLRNSVVANNIFVGSGNSYFSYAEKHINDETGDPVYEDFDGIFSNNCLWGVGISYLSENNYICDPGFVGDDYTDPDSFRLSKESKLIGKGIKADEDMGEKDFYGNKITSVNIGCYCGEGEDTELDYDILNYVKVILITVRNTITNFFETCNARFWLF